MSVLVWVLVRVCKWWYGDVGGRRQRLKRILDMIVEVVECMIVVCMSGLFNW